MNFLKSRTFYSILFMFIVGGVNGVHPMIPAGEAFYLDAILGIMATYFHLNPS